MGWRGQAEYATLSCQIHSMPANQA